MIRLSIALILLLLATPLWAEEECADFSSDTGSLEETAETATKVCHPQDLHDYRKIPTSSLGGDYFGHDPDKLCKCLSEAKFNEVRVPRGRKKRMIRYEYDKAIREKLNHSLNDLVGNFTKFDNLLLTKDHLGNIIDESEPLCNMEILSQEV